jgi:hypothetical protein
LPHFPAPKGGGKGEHKWVNPETFFDELPAVMKQVPPMPGEEALYNWIGSVLEAAAKNTQLKQTLKETAVIAERELIGPFFDDDSAGKQLDGRNTYTVTFAKVPPVKGFWSLTLYNDEHMFNPNALKRYSLGTKNKTLNYNADGSLTLYAGAKSPGADKESNWLPAPEGTFSLYIRAYWADQAILDGTWQPPAIAMVR